MPFVVSAVDAALAVLAGMGAVVSDVEIPHMEYVKVSSAITMPEAYAYHAPDLLEALKQITRLSSEGEVSARMQYALGDVARAAIAKATGEAA